MKKLFITLTAIIFVTACATIPVQNPVCPQEDSWICEKSAELGVQPEQVYGWIYDAAAIAAITDVIILRIRKRIRNEKMRLHARPKARTDRKIVS